MEILEIDKYLLTAPTAPEKSLGCSEKLSSLTDIAGAMA